MDRLEREILKPGELAGMVDRIAARELDPYTAADQLISRAGLKAGPYEPEQCRAWLGHAAQQCRARS